MTVCTRKINIITTKQTGWTYAIPTIPKNRQATTIAPKEELRATHEVKCHSVITAKDVMTLLPPECRTPVIIKRTDGKEGEMPEATDITKRIEETLPERNETKTNVAIKGRDDISKHKDVFEKY